MAARTVIVSAVAELVHVADTDARVLRAVDAAAGYVVHVENVDASATPDDPVAALPSDALVESGLIGFARALYLDAIASRGQQIAVGDGVVDTLYTPEDLYRHWRHYFAAVASSWGIA